MILAAQNNMFRLIAAVTLAVVNCLFVLSADIISAIILLVVLVSLLVIRLMLGGQPKNVVVVHLSV